ncbi:MAG: DMT family transporter [Clostridia bacterium]|nr:DMT family transporter [Clostridia bacterium]
MKKDKNKLMTNIFFVAAIAVFCTLLWGTAFPVIKIGYELFQIETSDIPSKLIFAGERFALAGLIVLFIGLFVNRKALAIHKKDILPICTLSLFQTFFQYLLLYIGLVNVTGTKSSILTSVATFGSIILSAILFKNDKLSIKKIIGCAVGIIGIVVMNINGDIGGFTFVGDGLVILSNLSGAVGNVVSKKISGNRNPIQISGWQLTFGGSALIIVGAAFGGKLTFYNFNCIICLVYLAAMAGIAFMLWTMLLFFNDVSRVAVFNLLIPVFGTMWSGIFLGENIFTLSNMLSLLLVCSGIFLVNFNLKKGDNKIEKNHSGNI